MNNQRFMVRPKRRLVEPVNAVVPIKEYVPKSTASKVKDALWNNKGKIGKALGLSVLAAIAATVANSQLNKKSKPAKKADVEVSKEREDEVFDILDKNYGPPKNASPSKPPPRSAVNILDNDVITPDMLINPSARKNNIFPSSNVRRQNIPKPRAYLDFDDEQKSAYVPDLRYSNRFGDEHKSVDVPDLRYNNLFSDNPYGRGRPSTKSRGGARSSIDKFRNEYIMQQLLKVKKSKQLPPPKTLREKKIRQIMQQQEIPRSVAVKYLDASGW
jgi:hypothetical protein